MVIRSLPSPICSNYSKISSPPKSDRLLAASELGVEDGAPVAGDENGGQPSAFHAGRTGRVSMLERPATFAAGSTSGVEREGKMNQAMVEPL